MTAIKPFQSWLKEPVSGASVAVFRIGFGLMMALALGRFWLRGWIDTYYVQPRYHFSYHGFEWIQAWPGLGMYLHVAVLILAALAIALGWHYRLACVVFFLGFSWIELIDKTPYLNHYYAICLFAFLMIWLPLDQSLSLRQREIRALPRGYLFVLQLQIGLIYVFAGIAKIQPDWLLAGEPLKRWLLSEGHLQLIGPLLLWKPLPWLMAWAGMFFDLTIPFWLIWKKARLTSYSVLLVFHGLTALLFPIGIFPFLMSFAALLFFDPNWPLKWLPGAHHTHKESSKDNARSTPETCHSAPVAESGAQPNQTVRLDSRLTSVGLSLIFLLYFAIQFALPLRSHLYPGSVLWHEQGFRFSWRVMVMEKTGWLEYRLVSPAAKRTWRVSPQNELTPFQVKMLSTQADMIHQYAQHLGQRWQQKGFADIEVYADSFAALNGRPSQHLIDPKFDLMTWPVSSLNKPFIVDLEN